MSNYLFNYQDFIASKKQFVISIGKRQPMHIVHKLGLERITHLENKNLIYVIGSTNSYGDKFYDPYTNPLTIDQQITQFKRVFPDYQKVKFVTINDVPEMNQWGPILLSKLSELDIKPEDCIIYFSGKNEDKITQELSFTIGDDKTVSLNPGQWLIEGLAFYGFDIFFDKLDLSPDISARNLRKLDLFNLLESDKILYADLEFLQELVRNARRENPNDTKDIPITLEELSLKRIRDKV